MKRVQNCNSVAILSPMQHVNRVYVITLSSQKGETDFRFHIKRWISLTCVCDWFLSYQKSSLMFKRLDASTLPEDILSDTQTLPMMAHSAGSALWVRAPKHICYVCSFGHSCLFTCSSCPIYRTRGGFVALSPISPQELFLQPISSDIEGSQQENPVRENRCEQTHTAVINSSHYAGLLPVLGQYKLWKHCFTLQVAHVLWHS